MLAAAATRLAPEQAVVPVALTEAGAVLLLPPRPSGIAPEPLAANIDEFDLVWGPEKPDKTRAVLVWLDVLQNDRGVLWIQALSLTTPPTGGFAITPDAKAITYT
jgi:hypothetical protein